MQEAASGATGEMKHLHRAIARLGAPKWEILTHASNAELLDLFEAEAIAEYDATNPRRGYNSNKGIGK
jgi:hypothetical protein